MKILKMNSEVDQKFINKNKLKAKVGANLQTNIYKVRRISQ